MTRYALLIGCDEYTNFPETDFGCADMNLIMETLGEYCDYESKNIMTEPLYKNCDILPDDIYNKLLDMIKKLEEDSLLFYFAGHGVKEENEGYLILSDTKLSDIQNTALSLSKINNILKDTKRNFVRKHLRSRNAPIMLITNQSYVNCQDTSVTIK